MGRVSNINCKHYEWGMCSKKPRRFFGLFKTNCPEVNGEVCEVAERYPKPPTPPPPPPKRFIREDIQPLTEGKVRGGMNNAMKKTYSRPTHPPMPGKKDTIKTEVLKKLEQK